MAETLLQYLTKRNPTVTASSVGTSNFTYSQDWEIVEDLAVWTEFTYETLVSRFGEDLRREVPRFDATANSEQGGYNRIYNERGLTDLVCQSIMGPVSAVLGPLFITSSGRVMENLGCDPDWGAGHEGSSNANGRSKALILGDTKYKWSSTSAINTVRNKVDGSYEDSPTRDAVRPLEQVMYYGSLYKCRYAFIITEKELLVVRLHLAPDPIRTSPRPVRTRHPPSPHQRTLSSSTISRQFSDMSINESDLRPRIGLLKYKSIAWSANSGLTVKLALYLLTRLAHVDGSDLRHDYPPLASSVALSPSPSVPGNLHTDKGKGKEAMGIVTPSETSSKRKADPQIQPNQVSTKKSRDQLDRPRTDKSGYIDVKVHWNKERTGYNYAVGDPKVPDNYIINDPAVNWREIVEGKIYNFTREPYLRSDKP